MGKPRQPTVAARKNSEFYTCQFQSLAPYILPSEGGKGRSGKPSWKAIIVEGTLVRVYERFRMGVPLMTWKIFEEEFIEVWNKTVKKQQEKHVDSPLTEEDKALCLACLRHYYERYKGNRDRIEQPKGFHHSSNVIPEIHHSGIDYRMTGSLDRLDYSFVLDGLILIEYKVKATDLSQKEIDDTFNTYEKGLGSIQLGHYAHILSLMKPGTEVKLCRLILITPIGVYDKEWGIEGIERLKKQALLSAQNYIEMHSEYLENPYKFKCQKNAFCNKCSVKEYCLTWCKDKKIAVNPIPSEYFERIKKDQGKYEYARNNSRYKQLDLLELIKETDVSSSPLSDVDIDDDPEEYPEAN